MRANEVLKHYFLQELEALRTGAARFAHDHPVAARQLGLRLGHSRDPQIELLLQSFAYLTGQLRYALDCQDAILPGQLIEALRPEIAGPLPALAVMQLSVDGADANFAQTQLLPAQTEVSARASWNGQERHCRFTTLDPLELWPLKVVAVEPAPLDVLPAPLVPQEARSALRVRLSATGAPLAQMPIERLRFFLGGPHRFRLFDTLSQSLLAVATAGPGGVQARLASGDAPWRLGVPLAATDSESRGAGGQPVLERLREYFACPERFLFCELQGLSSQGYGSELDLFLLLSSDCPPLETRDLRLNCVPIINLYRQRVEPIVLRAGRVEYPLIGDHLRHSTCEVGSVRSLCLREPSGRERQLAPLYGDAPETEGAEAFWVLRREVSQLPSIPGTEAWVSFLDRDFGPLSLEGATVGGSAWCSDRRLPEKLPLGCRLRVVPRAASRHGLLLTEPSRAHTPASSGEAVQRSCAQLSDYCLPLAGGPAALAQLKEVLSQHCDPEDPRAQQQLLGLSALRHERIAERTGQEAWHGLSPGVQLTLVVDSSAYTESSALLLGERLSECFAGFAPLNSFVRLQLVDVRGEALKVWPARSRAEAA